MFWVDLSEAKEMYILLRKERMKVPFYILTLFLGSTTISLGEKFFLNPNEMIASPR